MVIDIDHRLKSKDIAPILVKHSVVEDAFRETDLRLVNMSAIGTIVISSAYREGMAAGDQISLSWPVGGDGGGQLS